MIAKIIELSIKNRFLVILSTVAVVGWGIWAMFHLSLDAIPDLSDVQVIVTTDYPGQTPQVVDDQVTYPLTTRHARRARLPRSFAASACSSTSFVYVHLRRRAPTSTGRAAACWNT